MENDSFKYTFAIDGSWGGVPIIEGVPLFNKDLLTRLHNLQGHGVIHLDKTQEFDYYVFSLGYYPSMSNRTFAVPGRGRIVQNLKNFSSRRQIDLSQYSNTWYPEGIDLHVINYMSAQFERFVSELESDVEGLIESPQLNSTTSIPYFNTTSIPYFNTTSIPYFNTTNLTATATTATISSRSTTAGQVSNSSFNLKDMLELEKKLLMDDYVDSKRHFTEWDLYADLKDKQYKDYLSLTSLKTSNAIFPYNKSDISIRTNGVDDSYDVFKLAPARAVQDKPKDPPPPPPQLELF